MKTSELTRNAGAIALGLLVSGAIVFGQRNGTEAWPSGLSADATADRDEPDLAHSPHGFLTGGPRLATVGCPGETGIGQSEPELAPDSTPESAPELMQTE